MAGVKKEDFFNGITIQVNGEVLGKIKDWKPAPLTPEEEVAEYTKPQFGSEPWGLPSSDGRVRFPNVTVDVRIEPEIPLPLFLKAQLAMWGIEPGDTFPITCIELLVYELEQAGYFVWFDVETGKLDEQTAEDCEVVIENFKMDYVSRGEDDS